MNAYFCHFQCRQPQIVVACEVNNINSNVCLSEWLHDGVVLKHPLQRVASQCSVRFDAFMTRLIFEGAAKFGFHLCNPELNVFSHVTHQSWSLMAKHSLAQPATNSSPVPQSGY